MDDSQGQGVSTSTPDIPVSGSEVHQIVEQLAGLLARIEGRIGGLEVRIEGLGKGLEGLERRLGGLESEATVVSAQLRHFSERMEDLEDRDRYARRASRFIAASPRTVEQYRTSAGSINAGSRDVDIFPSLSQ